MSQAYYTSQLSDNLEETPEGFLISRGTTIARTGWQTYKVGDLPREAADALGVDTSNLQADIDLYRSAEEVFNDDSVASFEGKPVTDNHPPTFVTPENFKQYACGHLQNVRRGTELLDNGEIPLIADVLITAEPLLSKVRNKLVRELSGGYDYSIRKLGDKILQCDIVGNHVAVVPKGRAGPEARINDSAPEPTVADATSTVHQPIVEVAPVINAPSTLRKEKSPVKNILHHILGLGFKAYAQDADPEELAAAAKQLHEEPPGQTGEDKKRADDRKPAEDRSKRLHDALDRAMDGKGRDAKAVDADIEELKKLMGDFFNEEEEEPAHSADEVEVDLDKHGEDGEACAECGKVGDECECGGAMDEEEDGPGEVTEEGGEEEVRGEDYRVHAADGARATLVALRPFIARSNDSNVKKAFNAALRSVTRSSKASTGSYGGFASAARARDHAPKEGSKLSKGQARDGASPNSGEDRVAKMQKFYDDAFKGGK